MLNSQEQVHFSYDRRQILVADDEVINRELLGHVLSRDYDVIFACDGGEALELIRLHRQTLSLVLLDLMMPGMSGLELLRLKRDDPEIQKIPVIVVTADQKAEVECLTLGATDFIPKPYPQADVILARIRRIIELSEDREIIFSTERDTLTGLYSREYFYRYARQLDQHRRDLAMDAIVLDVNHFHMINERFGTPYGDEVLRRIGRNVREMVQDSGGIVCRRGADTFMVYCPHGKDYRAILDSASAGLTGDGKTDNRVRLRMGVYENVDKSLEIERRFDHAKSAADSVRNSFSRAIGFYDSALHDRELFHEQLIEDFHTAIEEGQFEVWYQPKFDVRTELPVLSSAEALVRWRHPRRGLISPGVFIPLFEHNGLIETLDGYVWRETAAQMRHWKERLGFRVPVSVNVSRIDMYNPELVEHLARLLEEYGLKAEELLLEITESAYTQDSAQIIQTVERLRSLGFRVEMDDFGTGYSSLNMISALPIDALKLDMQFIRGAFDGRRNTRMLEVILEIADYLSVPVIAEGVETEEQLSVLKAMGCDLVQGYYFSRPLPAGEFERFLVERRDTASPLPMTVVRDRSERRGGELSFAKVAKALSRDIESIYYVDIATGRYMTYLSDGAYGLLEIGNGGEDFFAGCQRDIQKVVYSGDWDKVASALDKKTLLSAVETRKSFSMDYRLMIEGQPRYYRMKVIPAEAGAFRHIIVGVSNVDAQITEEQRQEAERQSLYSVFRVAQALAQDYFVIYYVDIETDYFIEFSGTSFLSEYSIEKRGEDFFALSRKNLKRFTYPEDQPAFLRAFTKKNLLKELDAHGTFSYTYRMMIGGEPTYVMMKASRLDERHIVIGTSNINAEMQQKENARVASSIAEALSSDYFLVFYVDTQTDRYLVYHGGEAEGVPDQAAGGNDFFRVSRDIILPNVMGDKAEFVRAVLDKEHLLNLLNETGSYTLEYRLRLSGVPTYVHMKASRMADRSDPHIVLGLRNIDAQVRHEQEQARALRQATELVGRDALTNVKSKRAYVETELQWDELIETETPIAFSVAVFDVNGLKQVNDTLGHAAGDEYIRSASSAICDTFKHSPVFRIGGDEFAAILSGTDYENRAALVERFRLENEKRESGGGVVVACGLADYRPGEDNRFQDVFERADAEMYENKRMLKGEASS